MSLNPISNALILNVDDSDGARYSKSRILNRAGFTVIEANSGAEALQKALQEQPNLILLDVKLPDINGIEVCRRLKEDVATQTILILQTSASFHGSADKIKALDSGADNYLVEPIEPDELIANVKALLRLGMVERELRDVDRRKNEFLATLAHELRNPLGPIRTSVELLRILNPNAPAQEQNARMIIQRHADHLARLVDDLLDVSRISQSKISLQQQQVELKSFIETALESSAQTIENRQHQLSVELPEKDVWLYGDPVRLSQIVTNVLRNAAKFTPKGGKILLHADLINEQLSIRITDTGIGISKENLEQIFELFTQSGHVNDLVQDGLGIGLSLVRTLVHLHHGEVRAFSEGINRGSCFEIILPVERVNGVAEAGDSVDPASVHDSRHKETQTSKRVLIIDDNVDAADSLAQLLALCGHQTQATYNGRTGVNAAAQNPPEIIFLDIGLPDMTGFEAARLIRALPQITEVKLVALTGYGGDQDRQNALDAGFDEHIAKPVEFSTLKTLGL